MISKAFNILTISLVCKKSTKSLLFHIVESSKACLALLLLLEQFILEIQRIREVVVCVLSMSSPCNCLFLTTETLWMTFSISFFYD